MTRLERQDENEFVAWAESQGFRAEKLIFEGRRGMLDRTLFLPDRQMAFLEFKRPGNTTSKQQDDVIKWLKGYGHDVCVPYSADEAIAFVKGLLG